MYKCLMFFLLFIGLQVQADYRVYLLQITNTQTNEVRTVRSTLDHIQYPMMQPLRQHEKIETMDSWRCRGNTSHYRLLCPRY